MHHSKRLAILLAVSLFMGSTVGTSAMAAETVEEMASAVNEKDISSIISEDESAAEETAVAEEIEVVVPDDNEDETEADQEAVSGNGESADHNDDAIDVQDETKDEEIPEEADLDSQDKAGEELLTEKTTAESEADTQEVVNEAKFISTEDDNIGEGYQNATEISVNDELDTYLDQNYAYYKFTPEKDGIYNLSVNVYGPMHITICLYDDGLNLLAVSSGSRYEIADRLEASRTYYYRVYSDYGGNSKIQLKETTFFAYTAQSDFTPKFGEEITLSVNASSDKPIEYAWYDEDYNLIEGVESADYTFVPEKMGYHEYRCEVTDGVNSATVFFTVELKNYVHAEAVCTSFNVNRGETVTLEVNAYSDSGVLPSYKWYYNNSLVSGDNGKPKSVLTVYADENKEYVCYAYINNAISSPAPQLGEIVGFRFYINVNDQPTHVHDLEKTEEKEATCTEDGNIEYWTCSECGKIYSDEEGTTEITEEDTVITSPGHNWSDWTVTKPATETETGLREKTCSVCGEKVEEVIPVLKGTWIKNSVGWWYQWSDGSYPRDRFLDIDGKTYYFNGSGYMVTGWQKIDGDWYYFNGSGVKQTGWQRIGDTWYYFDEDGVMAADEWIGDYYFSAGGAMATGWQKIDGSWYYFNGSGVKQTGWQRISNTWYFFDEDGVMAADEWVDNYYFSAGGAMATGWQKIDGSWYYFNGSGVKQTGWQRIGDIWYFFDEDGVMAANEWVGSYYFSAGGAMVTGWQKIDGDWYYFEGNGAKAVNKWVGNYYLGEDGVMATNTWIGSYYLGADGKWIPDYKPAI